MERKRSKPIRDQQFALVYSTDPIPEKRCIGCNRVNSECVCPALNVKISKKLSYRIERKGRGGKTVTIISNLPAHETLLKELCSLLKRSVGGGGTYYIESGVGSIEIQGERMEDLRTLVENYIERGKI